jgi:hypothetical protein
MTRARLIEKVIADYLEERGWRPPDPETGWINSETDGGINLPDMASAIEAEFDRIAREATR